MAMSDERLAELRAVANERLKWSSQDDLMMPMATNLSEAVDEIDRLRAEVERLSAAFAELLECHAVPGYIQLDKDFHERMKRTLGPGATHD